MGEPGQHLSVCVKREYVRLVCENIQKIQEIFAVRLSEKTEVRDVSKSGVFFCVESEQKDELSLPELISKIQFVKTEIIAFVKKLQLYHHSLKLDLESTTMLNMAENLVMPERDINIVLRRKMYRRTFLDYKEDCQQK